MLRRILKKLKNIDYKSPKFLMLFTVWLVGTIAMAVVFDRHEGQATDLSHMSEFEIEVTISMRGGNLSYSVGRVMFNTAFSSFALFVILNVFHKMTSRSKYDQDH